MDRETKVKKEKVRLPRYDYHGSAFRGIDCPKARRDAQVNAKLLLLPWNAKGLEEALK